VRRLAVEHGPVHLPLHPRTRDRLVAAGLRGELDIDGVTLLEPLRHVDLLHALASSRLVVTDSGGLQEEASWYGVPAIVLRTSTPRPEGVELGQAALVGLDPRLALAAAASFVQPAEQARVARLDCPYGDGRSGQRIAGVLRGLHDEGALVIGEPVLREPVPA
jgi:UDP-N-acetylglucosamine 2-epimerase (non-hydrolysing)